MSRIPLTYVFEFGVANAPMRPYIMHEFARHGHHRLAAYYQPAASGTAS